MHLLDYPVLRTFLVVAMIAACPSISHADIYKYVDKHGRVLLTDKPDHSGYQRLVKTWKGWVEQKSSGSNQNFAKNREKYAKAIEHVATRYQLPHALLHAVITAESSYNANAVSRAGAVGLMQLMPETARRYGVKDRRNPLDNINGGTRYLRDLLRMFNNNLPLALAAYNAGENAVKEYGNKIPPYSETRTYVNRVIQYYKKYKKSMS
ncbi:MAG: hypothetical protein A2W28_02225 [Gammaproteobacteria bacterium RBG_16_51_14]|nr:MAG: hypothetical protein A2W28_02225 [Gammaproteobacteria bacterium RBG_16_51_14]